MSIKTFDYEVAAGETNVALGTDFTYDGSTNAGKSGFVGILPIDDGDRIIAPPRVLFNDPNPLTRHQADKDLTGNTIAVVLPAAITFSNSVGAVVGTQAERNAAAIDNVFGTTEHEFTPLDLGTFTLNIDEKFLPDALNNELAIILEDRTAFLLTVTAAGAVTAATAIGHAAVADTERRGRLAGRF